MTQINDPSQDEGKKATASSTGSPLGGIALVLVPLCLVFALLAMQQANTNSYNGGGEVKMSIPSGQAACLITVAQDDGAENVYTKMGASMCVGFGTGERVSITRGLVD